MSSIGEMVFRSEGSGAAGYWKAQTWRHSFKGAMFPTNTTAEQAPDYELHAQAPHGNQVQVGVAWKKKNSKTGGTFFSIQLNHPEIFAAPVNLAAFPLEGADGVYEIVLSRPRGGQQAAEDAA